jgi:hypothetical protein
VFNGTDNSVVDVQTTAKHVRILPSVASEEVTTEVK